MNTRFPQRVVLGASSLSIRDFSLVDQGAEAQLRAFVDRAFSVAEVRSVDFDRQSRFGRIRYASRQDLGALWRRLGRALRLGPDAQNGAERPAETTAGFGAAELFLDAPGPVRVRRAGETLTTFRARLDAPDRIRIGHPLLQRQRDMAFRLEEELAALPGVRDFRVNPITSDVTVWLESGARAPERLLRELERAWPRLLDGLDGPPSSKRLAISGGLFGLSAVATFVAPALLPLAVAGVAIYGAPNLLAAARELRRGQVGLSALYATGLLFFLATRSPLTSTLVATLTQLWPRLARDKAIASQRRLLSPWRRRPRWAWRVLEDGEAIETPAEDLVAGDLIVLRRGETSPVDGRIERGLIATVPAGGVAGEPQDRQAGDLLRAGELVLDGEAFLRVARTAAASTAALIEARLPHGPFRRLPSLDRVEEVANRNARPTLVVAFYQLAATRTLRPAQGIIRPDYATAPRLSAELSAEASFVEALRDGALFLRPAALDRLAEADVVVLDDSAPLLERPLEIARAAGFGVSRAEALTHAAAAFAGSDGAQARALRAMAGSDLAHPAAGAIRRRAGCLWYEDPVGGLVEVAASSYLLRGGLGGPEALARAEADVAAARDTAEGTVGPQPLWVLRDGAPIGRVEFRLGAPRPARASLDQLRAASGPATRILLLSAAGKRATADLGAALGTDFAIGGLSAEEKAHVIRGLGRRTVWVGDGAAPRSFAAMAASDASLSTAAPSSAEQADALLLGRDLDGILAARTAARRRKAVLAADYRVVYGFNLAAAAAALAAGFGGFQSGLLSNVGTAAVYANHVRRLDALSRDQARRTRAALRDFSA